MATAKWRRPVRSGGRSCRSAQASVASLLRLGNTGNWPNHWGKRNFKRFSVAIVVQTTASPRYPKLKICATPSVTSQAFRSSARSWSAAALCRFRTTRRPRDHEPRPPTLRRRPPCESAGKPGALQTLARLSCWPGPTSRQRLECVELAPAFVGDRANKTPARSAVVPRPADADTPPSHDFFRPSAGDSLSPQRGERVRVRGAKRKDRSHSYGLQPAQNPPPAKGPKPLLPSIRASPSHPIARRRSTIANPPWRFQAPRF